MPSSASTPTDIYPLSLHDALPICLPAGRSRDVLRDDPDVGRCDGRRPGREGRRRLRRAQHLSSGRRGARDRGHGRDRDRPRKHGPRSEEHTSELQSRENLVCRLLLPRPPTSTLFPYTTLFRSAFLLGGLGMSFVMTPMSAAAMGAAPVAKAGVASGVLNTFRQVGVALGIAVMGAIVTDRASTALDRKSTRLNSSHVKISYAVFCFHAHRHLPSFPTRRSSDLPSCWAVSGCPS